MDPDIVFTSSLGLDDNMAPGNSTGHSDWHEPHGIEAFGYQHGPTWQPRPPGIGIAFIDVRSQGQLTYTLAAVGIQMAP